MCGITGAISFDLPAVSSEQLKLMTAAISHRGPDEESFYTDEYLSLGFRRLSIIDIENGHQPIWNEDKSILVVVNGEIYNHQELRQELEAKHTFATNSDSEVVLHLYAEFGVEAFSKLNGMFAVVIWDKRCDKLVLARDRLGIKPLYLSHVNDKLLFASELKSLLMHEDCPKNIRWSDLDILNLQQKSTVSTYVDNVSFLEAGSYATFEKTTGLVSKKYWDINRSFSPPSTKTREQLSDEYAQLLEDSVKIRLMSEVPVGVFLSGGIDSAIITAMAAKYNENIHCFTVVERTTFRAGDVQQAYQLTKNLGIPFYPVLFDPDLIADSFDLAELERMVYLIESPRFDPEWLFKSELHRAAKHYVPNLKVILLGQGADEFAGGYSSYLGAPYSSWEEYLEHAVLPDIEYYKKQEHGIPERLNRYTSDSTDASFSLYQRKMKLLTYQLQYFNLWHEDRTSSFHSVESRVPFLDHRIVELLASVPEEKQKELFWNKKIVRDCLSTVVEDYPKDKLKVPFFATDDISSINEFAWKIAGKVYIEFRELYLDDKRAAIVNVGECEYLYKSISSRRYDMYESAWKLLELMSIAIFNRFLKEPTDFAKYKESDKAVLPLVEENQWSQLAEQYGHPAINKNIKECDTSTRVSIPENCEILNPLSESEGSTCLILSSSGGEVKRIQVPDSHYWLVQVIDEVGQLNQENRSLEFWRSRVNIQPTDFYPVMNDIIAGGFLEVLGD